MKTRKQSFFARLRQRFLMWRVEREIYGRIFPHLNRQVTGEYPFQSDDDLLKQSVGSGLEARYYINLIDCQAAAMGRAYGQAFQYIVYRDLNARLLRYLRLVQSRVSPEHRIAKYTTCPL